MFVKKSYVDMLYHKELANARISIHNNATHLNKCLIRNKNKNETLLVNVTNSTVKNIFENVKNIFKNGMIPKLIQKTAHHSVEYILWAN